MIVLKIVMVWDEFISFFSVGNMCFVIEQQFNYLVMVICVDRLCWVDLSQYQVFILLLGNYSCDLGKVGVDNIGSWVSCGGVLIMFLNVMQWVVSEFVGFFDVKWEYVYSEEKSKLVKDGSLVEGIYIELKDGLIDVIENDKDMLDSVVGVLVNVEVDQEYWLIVGVNLSVVGMVYGNDIYVLVKFESGKNVVWFVLKDNVLVSGYLWEENKF